MQDNAVDALLILIVPPKLEEVLVDFLLQQNAITGFTSTPVSGHGSARSTDRLSLVEQVTGRQGQVQFMLHASLPVLHALIAEIKVEFENTRLHYILLPVLEAQSV
jgi:nitrogen regulatory protein PII